MRCVKVDDGVGGAFEGDDNGVGWKDGEVGVELVEEAEVVFDCAANAVCKEEHVASCPGDGLGRVCVTCAGSGHDRR